MNQCDLPPSACTWGILEKAGRVEEFSLFYTKLQGAKTHITESVICVKDYVQRLFSDIKDNAIPENEGYAQICCIPFIAPIVSQLNELHANKYKYAIYPTVKSAEDKRSNKKGDWCIYRIYNKRTYVIIECKKEVGLLLSNTKALAQLITEALLFVTMRRIHTQTF